MSNLKGILFNQFASEGVNLLIKDLQSKYKPKKGRRFHHSNITYEIGRPNLNENNIEFEISSKIPQDEVETPKDMKGYFSEIKKMISREKKKPKSVEMENIVWDSKKDTEKERDYVKVVYEYPLDQLYSDEEIAKRCEEINRGEKVKDLPEVPSVFTLQGKLVLVQVREKIQEIVMKHVTTLIDANKKIREK